MFDIFGNVKSLLKIQSVHIDSNVFRLHYQLTVFGLVLFSVLVVSRQYFGDPIDCTQSDTKIDRVLDNYCWMHTYMDSSFAALKPVDFHPGMRSYVPDGRIEQGYYQWVGFILFFQALLFYIPRYFWKHCWEEGKIKGLAVGLKGPVIDHNMEEKRRKMISVYFERNIGHHNFYFFKYVLCEILNLANILIQMLFLNKYLDLMNFSRTFFELTSKSSQIYFPKVAKCDFSFLNSGGVQTITVFCALPVNIFNEKIFACMWVWFIILSVLTTLSLLYRLLTFIPCARCFLLHSKSRGLDKNVVRTIVNHVGVGDWFLLYQIGKNVDCLVFGEMLKDLCNLSKKDSERRNSLVTVM